MQMPLVSVLLVVRNERDSICRCIKSLVQQDYPHTRMEFLLIDGCSEDGTYALLQEEIENLKEQGFSARLFVNKKKILASGWNLGIREARGDFVCRIDAHSEIVHSYISTGISCLLRTENERVAAVGGWLIHEGTTRTGNLVAALLSSKFAVGDSPFRRRPSAVSRTDTAVYGVCRRSVFSEVGYFDEQLARNQDMVMHHQLREAGYTFLTHPDMEITYYVRATIGRLVKKAFGDGQWVALGGSKHFRLRHKIPFLFFGYLAVFIMTFSTSSMLVKSLLGKILLGIIAAPLFVYIALTVLFSLKISQGIIIRLLLAPLFFIFHVAYGIGTFWGYCQILLRNSRNQRHR